MGLPMAEALLTNNNAINYETFGYDIRPPDEFGEFQNRMLPALTDLLPSDVLLLVVRSSQQISDICFGDPGVYNKDSYPKVLIVSSTVSPRFILELNQQLPDDVQLIDAPMSGAPVAARNRTLTFMVGGDQAKVDELTPLFDVMGKHTFKLGDTGQGMLAKVLNNYIAASSVVSVRNSLAQAERLGMPSDTLLQVVNLSSGGNWFAANLENIDWCSETYDPTNTIGILEKDVTAALDVMNHNQPDTNQFGHALLDALREIPSMPVDFDRNSGDKNG